MAPPIPLKCLKSGCDFTTPQCPTWEPMMELLRMHVNLEHPSETPPPPAAGAGASTKVEKLPRPKLEEDITDSDWNYFCAEWARYKRSVKLAGQDIVDQLWATMSPDLKRQCHDHGASTENTTEDQLLPLMKAFATRGQNKLCNIVHFLNLKQEEGEPIAKFISRVRGEAKTCEFKIKCSKVGCSQENSYADKLSAHVVVRGLNDPEIQEDVLKLAATSEVDLTLQKITEVTVAQETGARSRRLLNEDLEFNKLSQHQKQKRNASGNSNDLLSNEKCYYCGQCGHGYKASSLVRKELCPAFSMKCSKCNLMGHLASECKRKQILAAAANALNVDEERSSKSSSDSEHEANIGQFGFFNMKTAGRPSSPPAPSSDSDHYDADSDRSSVSSNKAGENFGWFCMSLESPSIKSSNKSKLSKPPPNYEMRKSGQWKIQSAKSIECKFKYRTSALQYVLHQPSTQQMTGTPGTQWKEIATVADTLRKLSLLTFGHRTSSQEGGII